jgi:chaperonin cofactor prefoldin
MTDIEKRVQTLERQMEIIMQYFERMAQTAGQWLKKNEKDNPQV